MLSLKTSSYADLMVSFDDKHFKISGAVVESICSNIMMKNFASSPDFINMKLSMDFENSASKSFEIDVLLGLDILETLVGGVGSDQHGASSVVAKRVGNMLCIKISKDRYLPFGTNRMKPPSGKCSSSSSRPVNKRAMLTLGGPSDGMASTLDVILEEFF